MGARSDLLFLTRFADKGDSIQDTFHLFPCEMNSLDCRGGNHRRSNPESAFLGVLQVGIGFGEGRLLLGHAESYHALRSSPIGVAGCAWAAGLTEFLFASGIGLFRLFQPALGLVARGCGI